MMCSLCGGLVTWRGPLVALTHTQCDSCGERNCQVVADADDEYMENERCPFCNGDGADPLCDYAVECPRCGGDGLP